MKIQTVVAVVPFLLALTAGAEAACVYPQAPQTIPNGATATKEEMLATQTLIKDYANNVQVTYLACLDLEKQEALGALDPADREFAAKKTALESIHAKKHNSALDELQALVTRWNDEKKAFGAKDAK